MSVNDNKKLSAEIPHKEIYKDYCEAYDRLRSLMDFEGNLIKEISKIVAVDNAQIVEIAAGTGKLTSLLAPLAKKIEAFDTAGQMVAYAAEKFRKLNISNVSFKIADNRQIPLPDEYADLIIEGWSLGYMVALAGEDWQKTIDNVLTEMFRLLKPGGTAMILGTLGTGAHNPKPPNTALAQLYEYLTIEHGFIMTDWFKTDYQFDSVEEAAQLTSFFWSKKFGAYIGEKQMRIVPECTAIWFKRKL